MFVQRPDPMFGCKCVMYLFDVFMCHKVSLRFAVQVKVNHEASSNTGNQLGVYLFATVIALNYDNDVFNHLIHLCVCVYIYSYACLNGLDHMHHFTLCSSTDYFLNHKPALTDTC